MTGTRRRGEARGGSVGWGIGRGGGADGAGGDGGGGDEGVDPADRSGPEDRAVVPGRRLRRVVLGLLVVSGALGLPVTGVRALGGAAAGGLSVGEAPPFLQLLAFTPWFVLPCLAGLVVAVLARRRVVAIVFGVAVAAHLVWLAPAVLATGPGGREADLTVLTVNARLGVADPDELVAIVRGSEVDVLVVVELTEDLAGRVDEAGLAAELPYAELEPAPGAAGAGIWSRHPVTARPAVPGTTFAMPRAEIVTEATAGSAEDTGGAVEDPGGAVIVTAGHVAPPGPLAAGRWRRDLELLTTAVAESEATSGSGGEHTEPRQVVAGGLNATRDHTSYRSLVRAVGRDTADDRGRGLRPTWPQPSPFVAVDHVLVSGDVRVGRVERLPVTGTDHLGVLATLDLP